MTSPTAAVISGWSSRTPSHAGIRDDDADKGRRAAGHIAIDTDWRLLIVKQTWAEISQTVPALR
ncbi:hypothetical protein GOB93_19830 [Acetobacter musti]|uniref:Uncharacterized protein n=1 Tax=Acetobacter musti TaxID=864732 RepID=A0ABX0JUE0_9PROT|nr:hypothetical protein [Acetobacter musti]NHN86831.1 hypothetical protein [Acetobacter musti]